MKKQLGPIVAVLMLATSCAFADDGAAPVFSGPQVGEKLVPFTARGVLDDLAGKEFDLIAQADGKPVTIVFMHDLTRPSAAVTRAVLTYAAKQEGMTCGLVFLSDDATATEAQIKRAAHALAQVPIGISIDGGEGPGAYGLNRNVALTVLVGKEGKVTANFALVQPSLQADAPKIGQAIAAAVGKDAKPTLAQMGVTGQYAGQNDTRPQQDPNLRGLIAPVIQKDAAKEDVDQAAAKLEAYCEKNPATKKEVGDIARRIINAGVLENYGTPAAQEYLKKWAKEFVGDAGEKERPERKPRGNNDG